MNQTEGAIGVKEGLSRLNPERILARILIHLDIVVSPERPDVQSLARVHSYERDVRSTLQRSIDVQEEQRWHRKSPEITR